MTKLIKIIKDDVQIQKLVQRDDFLSIVNTPPPVRWIKDHPFIRGVKYIPIDKIELLLTRIFQEWRVEILRENQLANSVYVVVRLHYKDPIDGEWQYQDGIGAVPLKTRSGAGALDKSALLSDAVLTGLPAAESFAVKDAAEKIGRLFGKDINRKDIIDYTPAYSTEEAKTMLRQKLEKEEMNDANN